MKTSLLFLTFICFLALTYQYDAWDCMTCQQSISTNIREECRQLNPGNYSGQQICEKNYQEGVYALTSCLQTNGCFTTKNGYNSDCICANCTLTDYTKNNQPYNNFLKCLLDDNCGGDDRGYCFAEVIKSLSILALLLLFFIF